MARRNAWWQRLPEELVKDIGYNVYCLMEDLDGRIWVGTTIGLSIISPTGPDWDLSQVTRDQVTLLKRIPSISKYSLATK